MATRATPASQFPAAAADLPANRDRLDGDELGAIAPLSLGAIAERQRGGPPWGGTVADGIEPAQVQLVGADARVARSAADARRERGLLVDALRGCGLHAGELALVCLPADPEAGLLDIAAALEQLGAGAMALDPARPRRVIAEQRHVRARTLVTTRASLLGLTSAVYSEFPLEPADLGFERIVLVADLGEGAERERLSQEYEAEVGRLLLAPLGGALAWAADAGPLRVVDGRSIGCWDGERYGADGELVVTAHAAEAMPLVNVGSGRGATISDEGIELTDAGESDGAFVGHRLIATGSLVRIIALVPGVVDWELDVERPGTQDIARLRLHASRDDVAPIKRNAERELRERLALEAEVDVTPAGSEGRYVNLVRRVGRRA